MDASCSRRNFLKGLLAAGSFPAIAPASAMGNDGNTAPSDRIALGFVGTGDMGRGHVLAFLKYKDVRIAAVCDVREEHRLRAKQAVDSVYGDQSCTAYRDFRELVARPDIDAVVIAVPDHWHALVGIEAARNGKDLYYEKPMGVSFAEARAMREAVERHGVVFQFGTQQRSDPGYRLTCELIRNGRIGQLRTIMIGSAMSQYVPDQQPQPVPEGFDYDFWVGPAPWVPYTFQRCTRNWTLIYDYSLGCISGAWGIHDVDIAQWVNNADETGPVEAEGTAVLPRDGLYDTPIAWEVEHRYANGVKLLHMDLRTARRRAPQFNLGQMASVFFGSEGWIHVSRRGVQAQPESLLRAQIRPGDIRVPASNNHRRNFLEAVRTRRQPISPIEAAVRADTVCQQADIAIRLRRRLRWDPVREVFPDDEDANRMLARPMRSPWRLSA